MPIQYVAGDLFANAHLAEAFAHGCNCRGSMGAGIAVGFRERYPAMYAAYRARCKAKPREFNLGDAWLWKPDPVSCPGGASRDDLSDCENDTDDQPWVFNLATQEDYWRSRATYEAVETALANMRRQAEVEAITRIALPRIGVGLGGLSWTKVKTIIDRVFADWPGTLIVYEEYVPAPASPS